MEVKINHHTLEYALNDASQVGETRRFALALASDLGFEETRAGKLGIIVTELGNNLVRYAKNGRLLFRPATDSSIASIDILSLDHGPGLDSHLVMQDGYTTSNTPGTGLGAIRRMSDEFDIFSTKDKGTVIFSKLSSKDRSLGEKSCFEIGGISVPLRGETVCGDGWSARSYGNELGFMMVDGLGHGPAAHKVAEEAIEVFRNTSSSDPSQTLQLIHSKLCSTRGGAVFIVLAKQGSIDFSGVGNIRTILLCDSQSKALISQNGTAGLQIRTSRTMTQQWDDSGYVIMHSDGLTSSWDPKQFLGIQGKHPAIVAGVVYNCFKRDNDDASIAVFRRRP